MGIQLHQSHLTESIVSCNVHPVHPYSLLCKIICLGGVDKALIQPSLVSAVLSGGRWDHGIFGIAAIDRNQSYISEMKTDHSVIYTIRSQNIHARLCPLWLICTWMCIIFTPFSALLQSLVHLLASASWMGGHDYATHVGESTHKQKKCFISVIYICQKTALHTCRLSCVTRSSPRVSHAYNIRASRHPKISENLTISDRQ